MYLKYFGLTEKPFSLLPDPDYIFFSSRHQAAFAMLEYGLWEQSGITVITGAVGAGKTTLIRHLLRRIDYSNITVGMVNTSHSSFDDLLHWIVSAFGLTFEGKARVTLIREFHEYLIRQYASNKRVVLILDEAQNIEESALEELRLLSNINSEKDQLLQIILVGQPELLDTLRRPTLRQFAQRVCAEYHLEAMSCRDTIEYVRHRLKVAGGNRFLFDTFAIVAIYYYSGGVPRLVNTLCDQAMVHAYAAQVERIEVDIAMDVIKGKRIGGFDHARDNPEELEKARHMLKQVVGVDIRDVVNL